MQRPVAVRGRNGANPNAAAQREVQEMMEDRDNDGAYEDSGDEENDAEREMIRENGTNMDELVGRGVAGNSAASNIFKNVTGALMAKALFPTPAEIKKCLVYTDLAIKIQMIIFDLSSAIWWSTMAEFLIFFPFGFFIFCIDPSRMFPLWFLSPHLGRGVVGLLIIKTMPTTHEMISQIDLPQSQKIPFSEINTFVMAGARQSVSTFAKKSGKIMVIYSLLTLVCLVLDFCVTFVGIGGLNQEEGAFSQVFVFLLGLIYLMISLFFFGWIFAVRQRLPDYAASEVTSGLLGLFKKLTLAVGGQLPVKAPKPPATAKPVKGSAAPPPKGKDAAAKGKQKPPTRN